MSLDTTSIALALSFVPLILLLLLLLLLLLKRSGVLLFELLLEFLLVGILRTFLYHMSTRIRLNNFLAADILSSRLLFNIQRANEIGDAKLLSLMF